MGWDYCEAWADKKQVIEAITKTHGDETTTWTCVAHTNVGNALWTVWEVHNANITERFIVCDLLAKDDGCWGNKSMDESMAPYYYSCPLKFLDMAPVADAKWREEVKRYHEKKKIQRARKAAVQVGQTWRLRNGCKPPEVQITSVKPLRGYYNGVMYKVRSTHLDSVLA